MVKPPKPNPYVKVRQTLTCTSDFGSHVGKWLVPVNHFVPDELCHARRDARASKGAVETRSPRADPVGDRGIVLAVRLAPTAPVLGAVAVVDALVFRGVAVVRNPDHSTASEQVTR